MKTRTHSSRAAWAIITALLSFPLLATADLVQPVSRPDAAVEPSLSGAGDSGAPIISADGRYVLFASTADNLALDTNGVPYPTPFPPRVNVFLRDRVLANTRLVSASSDGTGTGNGDSVPIALSDDGRYALFESTASNLVTGDTNDAGDVFVRDMVQGATHLVSATASGVSGNGASGGSIMTPDGRYVAFVSAANDLVANDTNNIPDAFVRDMNSGATTLVSVGAMSALSLLGDGSELPRITPDGRHVAFYSTATNLVPGVNRSGGVYVRDLVGQTTILAVSNALATIPYSTESRESVLASDYRISADGRFIAFEGATNFVGGMSATGMVLRCDLQTGMTDVLHTNVSIFRWRYRARSLDMTADGRLVAFVANPGETASQATNAAYVWDALTGSNTLVSVDLNGLPGNGTCENLTLSPSGEQIAFVSSASGVVTNALEGEFHLYLRDLQEGTTRLVNLGLEGCGLGLNSATTPSISADSRFVAFDSSAAGMIAGDRNGTADAFIRDMTVETNELISVAHPGCPSITGNRASGFGKFSVSANGRHIAFASDADDLVVHDTNLTRDVFVRDLHTGTTILASADTNGAALQELSMEPAISGDGRYVAFTSWPVKGGSISQVYLRDMQQGTTRMASVGANGVTPGNNSSSAPSISDDGRWLLFQSSALNLTMRSGNLFLRDLHVGTNYALARAPSGTGSLPASMTPDGRLVVYWGSTDTGTGVRVWDTQLSSNVFVSGFISGVSVVAISPNGQRLAYYGTSGLVATDRVHSVSHAISTGKPSPGTRLQFSSDGRFLLYTTSTTEVAGDTNDVEDIHLYDFDLGARVLVSRADDGTNSPNTASSWPTMSPDARFIAYHSSASNIVQGDANGMPDVFLFDRVRETTTMLSLERTEMSTANSQSHCPVFSGNGQTLVFQSRAANLIATDFNSSSDVFAFQFLNVSVALDPAGLPLLSWPALPGHSYRAQYTTNAAEGAWRDVGGPISILDYRGFETDPMPDGDARFYRIISE